RRYKRTVHKVHIKSCFKCRECKTLSESRIFSKVNRDSSWFTLLVLRVQHHRRLIPRNKRQLPHWEVAERFLLIAAFCLTVSEWNRPLKLMQIRISKNQRSGLL